MTLSVWLCRMTCCTLDSVLSADDIAGLSIILKRKLEAQYTDEHNVRWNSLKFGRKFSFAAWPIWHVLFHFLMKQLHFQKAITGPLSPRRAQPKPSCLRKNVGHRLKSNIIENTNAFCRFNYKRSTWKTFKCFGLTSVYIYLLAAVR